MKTMRLQLFAVLVAASAFGLGATLVHADDSKKDDTKTEKKCCDDEKGADSKKADGCDKCEKGEGKAEEGCDGCGKSSKTFAKAFECKECNNSEKGPCDKCVTALKEGKVTFVPVSGMMCGNCEGAVSAKMEKVDGVQKYAVNHRFNGVAVFVEPGKTVKLSDITAALGKGKFKIDETAKLAGKYTFKVADAEKNGKTACDILCKLFGTECPSCAGKEKGCCLTFNLTGKDATIAQIKEKLAASKIELADIEIHGPKAEGGKS